MRHVLYLFSFRVGRRQGFWLLFGLLLGCRLYPTADFTPIPLLVTEPPPDIAYDSLTAVSTATFPSSDPAQLASQFNHTPLQRTARSQPMTYQVGDIATFWVTNNDTGEKRQISAELVYRSDALNLWLESGQRGRGLAEAATRIEQQILPTNRTFFGREWQPGIDGDLRLNILHARQLGSNIAAAFYLSDEYTQTVNPFSNEREILYVNLDAVTINSDDYFAAVAHELQHLIQWHTDSNEDLWLNEGLSELAVHLNGLPTNRERAYVRQTDLPLTALSQEPEVAEGHYAAAFLFAAYFFDRFGAEATQALVRDGENGRFSLNTLLAPHALTFDDLFADWLVANYLNGIEQGHGVYQYQTIALPPIKANTMPHSGTASVNQYGADFWRIENDAPVTLQFTGSRQTPLINANPHSGQRVWATLPGDGSDQTLSRTFDLAGLSEATFSFWTWYDIEEGWDYGYLALSSDNGRSWELLATANSQTDNPHGNSFGPGYTGSSGGWVQQTAVLTPYAGQTVQLRFHYLTDGAVQGQGWLLDDIALPELGYHADFEQDNGGWEGAGFTHTGLVLPQQFIIQQLLLGENGVDITRLSLDNAQQGTWTLPLDSTTPQAVIIVSGATPVTRQPTAYTFEWK
ncbi:MAG: immune inhibitor A [Ardenticatenaceae bacterium]|nr:immune inhibitor A [Ardenticatenaceae bacterium]